MHPQTELENYKLQVELLQEKLHRSEDNRQELEGKLEQIMKKRNEHERTLRSTSQRKYKQFLDEQKKRNERNRKLVEMLERIDQQAAALSARSERLKMMKLQYELYFSKLVQSYSMKTLQGIPSVPFLPIQRSPNTYTSIQADNVAPAEVFKTQFPSNTPQFQTVPIPMVVPISNEQNQFHRSWAFATAPPGVLISLANNSALPSADIAANKINESNFCFDYSQFPIGYLQNPTVAGSMQPNVSQSYLQQPLLQKSPTEIHSKPSVTSDDDIKQSRPHFEVRDQTPPSFLLSDIKTNEAISNRTQPETNPNIFDLKSDKPKRIDDFEILEKEANGQKLENFTKYRAPEMSSNDSSVPRQSLKVDKLPNINQNNSFQQRIEDGRIAHRGNKPNTIDFRTDDNGDDNDNDNDNDNNDNDDYIKYIKELKGTYGKNVPIPINVTPHPQRHIVDNITTALQTQKIDETNVRDDEKINYAEDNERNTSSAFPPLGGKCSIESIGDEALTKKPLENKTDESTSNTAARNIDLSRDTEQITLFNGTKNSKDESTGASNRTAAIIDGGGESIENNENTRLETNYRPMHFDKKKKMSIENIETAIYGELLPKPESFTAVGLLDKSRGNDVGENIERNSQKTEQYGFSNSGKDDFYEQEQETAMEEKPQDEPYPTAIEQNDAKNEEIAENYNYTDNDVQAYDMQNYNYADPVQEYKEPNQSEVPLPQQEYPFTGDEQQPQINNYATDYQNYDTSQYQQEYDPNAYQYDYEQQQYGDPNQAQYATEMYNQGYQPDPYSGEYANYEQNMPNEIDTSNQPYTEQQYAPEQQYVPEQQYIPEEPEAPREQIEKTIFSEQEPIDTKTEADIPKQEPPIVDEPNNEEVTSLKAGTPTSILATEKHPDIVTKKKKRVNFVDSETDESSTLPKPEVVSSESDFDFSAN